MRRLSLLLTLPLALACASAWGARVKDISRPIDARHNQLTGYGIVVGLNGTGDSSQTTFTTQSLSSLLSHFGVQVTPAAVKVKNVAAVMVTVDLPPYLKPGDRVDALVSSLGDASSLQGGLLIQTPLVGADDQVYVVAMGPVATNSFSVSSNGSGVAKNHPTVGLITSGALVERAVATTLVHDNQLCLSLNEPDFDTAYRLAQAVNFEFGSQLARVCDASLVSVSVPAEYEGRSSDLMVRLDNLQVTPDCVAKVVVNERTGTVVMGGDVTILPVAAAQAGLTVEIATQNAVSQPPPMSSGKTTPVSQSQVTVSEGTSSLRPLRGATVQELVRSLNAIKASPRDIIAILQAVKRAGALQAELEVI